MKTLLYSLSVFTTLLFMACGQIKNDPVASAKTDSVKSQPNTGPIIENETNYCDVNGKRQGPWAYKAGMPHYDLPGYVQGAKVEEGTYKDNKREGIWIKYGPDGTVESKTTYKNDSIVSADSIPKKKMK